MRRMPSVGRKGTFKSPSQGRRGGGNSDSSEVDLTPIMNLFVALIPVLLQTVMLVTVAYVALDLTVSNAGGAAQEEQNQKVDIKKLELTINTDNEMNSEYFVFKVNDKLDGEKIPATDLSALAKALKSYKARIQKDKHKVVTADMQDTLTIYLLPKPKVHFGTFVKTMDLCKKLEFKDIYLQDFKK